MLKPEAQYLFTINTETHVVQPVSCSMVPIRCIVPVAGNRFYLSDVSNIAECTLVEDSDGSYSLQRLSRGALFSLDYTIISLVSVIEYGDTEYLVLFKDKYFTQAHEK